MKSRKIVGLTLTFILALGLLLSGCGSNSATPPADKGSDKKETTTPTDTTKKTEDDNKPVDGGKLVIGSIGEPTIFNDFYSTDTSSSEISSKLYNGLVTFDNSLKPQPDLAESWEFSPDNLKITVKLKKDVKWQDGQPFTADDVVFSYNIPRSKDYAGPRASDFEKIKDIKKIDDQTVEIDLSEPYAPIMSTLAYSILPKHILKDVPVKELDKNEFNTKKPVGTGPYKFVEWKSGEYIKLTKNPDYFKGAPHIDELFYKFVPDQNALIAQLQAGEVDIIGVPSTDLQTVEDWAKKSGKADVITTQALSYTYLGYNMLNPLFKDKKVRQALTMALDRKAIVEAVLNGDGKVANAPASPLSWAYNDQVPTFDYDPEKAKQILADAGWKDSDGDGILDKGGKKFEFSLKTNQGNKARETIAQVVQQQMKKIGIQVDVQVLEWSAFINDNILKKKFDTTILGWSLGVDPDPSGIWHSKEAKDGGLNFISYKNPEADKLMDENTKILDLQKRKEVIDKINYMIADDQPYSFLYYPNDHLAIPANLKGYEYGPAGLFYNIQNIWLAPKK